MIDYKKIQNKLKSLLPMVSEAEVVQGPQTFFVKSQMVNILGFASHAQKFQVLNSATHKYHRQY